MVVAAVVDISHAEGQVQSQDFGSVTGLAGVEGTFVGDSVCFSAFARFFFSVGPSGDNVVEVSLMNWTASDALWATLSDNGTAVSGTLVSGGNVEFKAIARALLLSSPSSKNHENVKERHKSFRFYRPAKT